MNKYRDMAEWCVEQQHSLVDELRLLLGGNPSNRKLVHCLANCFRAERANWGDIT